MDVLAASSSQSVLGVSSVADPSPSAVIAQSAPVAAANAAAPPPANVAADQHPALAPAISKLFGSGIPQPVSLNVSYRVVNSGVSSEIVTVFTDPKTGQEVAQFPPEVLIGIAKFFDQQTGATLDRNA